jgi:GH43 family beta-xylosidase
MTRPLPLFVIILSAIVLPTHPALSAPPQYPAPLVPNRADPQILKHADGHYYLSATVPEYDRLELRRAPTLEGLRTAPPKTIWRKHDQGEMGAHIWAPELHAIDGTWYLYFAAGRADKVWDIRIYVLSNPSPNPLEGTWTERGQLKTNFESFSLDATTFQHRGQRYLAWAQHDPKFGGNTSLYLAKMKDPLHIDGTQVCISRPELPWETVGYKVNEGPAVLIRNGRVFLTYSASATDHHYCLGLLTADDDADLLNPASWTKSQHPVFQSSDETHQYGPGHNSFTIAEDDKTDLLVYHARNYKEIQGDPLHDPNRHTRVQPLTWNEDGTPHFGVPVADAPTPTPAPPAQD